MVWPCVADERSDVMGNSASRAAKRRKRCRQVAIRWAQRDAMAVMEELGRDIFRSTCSEHTRHQEGELARTILRNSANIFNQVPFGAGVPHANCGNTIFAPPAYNEGETLLAFVGNNNNVSVSSTSPSLNVDAEVFIPKAHAQAARKILMWFRRYRTNILAAGSVEGELHKTTRKKEKQSTATRS